ARAHGVSHPALTKSLRTLEGEVGVSLIRRSTRGVVCTPAGRAFLIRARSIAAELRKAQEELADLTAPGGGVGARGLGTRLRRLGTRSDRTIPRRSPFGTASDRGGLSSRIGAPGS